MRTAILQTVHSSNVIGFFIAMMVFTEFTPTLAQAESEEVGHVSGTITMDGSPPPSKKFNLATYPDPYYCGRVSDGKGWRLGPKVQLGNEHRMANAIIYIKDIETPAPRESRTTTVKARDCRFTPYIERLRTGDHLTFQNWDPVLHKLEVFQATAQGGRLLVRQDLKPHGHSRKSDFLQTGTTGLHQSGPAIQHTVNTPGVLFIRCEYHSYMQGWAIALSHPYSATSNAEGKFTIPNVPPGSYTLIIWHPVGQTERLVQIRKHETRHLKLELQPTPSPVETKPEAKPNPFGIELLGDSHIVPSVELQQEGE
ncbi:carboxypeptidase-like regulatory domain-containing protein [Nitrospira sp. M1]